MSDYFNNVSKYVVSNSMNDPQWERSNVLSGEAVAEVQELKAAAGKDIVTTGSTTVLKGSLTTAVSKLKRDLAGNLILAGSLKLGNEVTRLGLVDQSCMWVHPFVWAKGDRLYQDLGQVPLRLLSETTFDSGVALLRYEPSSS